MTGAEDRRVRKTREALQASFASLIVSKGYDALTIQDVLDDADVGRTTFYSHFNGKEDLLRSSFDRLRVDIERAGVHPVGEPFGFVVPLFEHAARHAGLYAALLGGSGGKVARNEACAVIAVLVDSEVERLRPVGQPDRDAVIAFITGGLVQALEVWARSAHRSGTEAFVPAVRLAATAALKSGEPAQTAAG